MLFIRCSLFVFATLFLTAIPHSAQETPIPDIQGVRSFNEGKYDAAINELTTALKLPPVKNDARIWNMLGTSYFETGRYKDAAKAFSKAKSIEPSNLTYRTNLAVCLAHNGRISQSFSELNKVLKVAPTFRPALYFRGVLYLSREELSRVEKDASTLIANHPIHSAGYDLMHRLALAGLKQRKQLSDSLEQEAQIIRDAKDWCDKGLKSVTDKTSEERLRNISDELGLVLGHIEKIRSRSAGTGATVNTNDSDRIPMKVISTPTPSYTDIARRAGKSGTITLLVVFLSNGKVGLALPLNSLGYGLDEQAVAAAKKFQFEPARQNGEPVTIIRRVEFSFSLY
jgi:TonB family protein